MRSRMQAAVLAATLGTLLVPSLAMAQDQQIEVLEDIETVLAVAPIADPLSPVGALMRADCPYLVRIEAEDGSSQEFASCMLSESPVDVPEFQGSMPTEPFVDSAGECIWSSDYHWTTSDMPVWASEFEIVALPSGRVHVWAAYPAEPLDCEADGMPEESSAAEAAADSPAAEEPETSPEA